MATHFENRARGSLSEMEHADKSMCQSMLQHPRETIEHTVRDNPMTATLTAFAVGLSVGTVVGCLLVGRTSERHHLATSLGSRMLDAVGEYIPQSIQQRFRS